MGEGPSRRDEVVDRRTGVDRRDIEDAPATARGGGPGAAPGSGAPSGFDRRRGVGRRLSDFTKNAEEGEFNREQFLFVQAIEAFKKANNKHYPTWTDVLEVMRLLGYRKTMKSEANVPRCEDWTERADAPSDVKSTRRKREAGEVDGPDHDA